MSAASRLSSTSEIVEIPLDLLVESRLNPRSDFDEAYIEQLAANIKVEGVHEPALVRKSGTRFELGQGNCRCRAARLAGLESLPCIVVEMNDAEFLQMMMSVQQHNQPFTPLDEARGYQRWMKEGKLDVEDVAARIGLSVRSVYNSLALLKLIPELQLLLRQGIIDEYLAVEIATHTPEHQRRILDEGLFRPIEPGLFESGDAPKVPVSVRELRRWIASHIRFDTSRKDLPMLFPETAAALHEVRSQPVKEREPILYITYESKLDPALKVGEEKILGPDKWKRADGKHGSQTCPESALGVVLVGEGWSEAFRVCAAKKVCDVHWGEERSAAIERAKEREAEEAATSAGQEQGGGRPTPKAESPELREAVEARERARWQKARPAILKALAAAVKRASTKPGSPLAKILTEAVTGPDRQKEILQLVPVGRTADDLVKHLAFTVMEEESRFDHLMAAALRSYGKQFGRDVDAILDEAAPADVHPKARETKAGAQLKAAILLRERIRRGVAKHSSPKKRAPAKKKARR